MVISGMQTWDTLLEITGALIVVDSDLPMLWFLANLEFVDGGVSSFINNKYLVDANLPNLCGGGTPHRHLHQHCFALLWWIVPLGSASCNNCGGFLHTSKATPFSAFNLKAEAADAADILSSILQAMRAINNRILHISSDSLHVMCVTDTHLALHL